MYNYIGQILHHTSKKMQHYLEAPHKSFFFLFCNLLPSTTTFCQKLSPVRSTGLSIINPGEAKFPIILSDIVVEDGNFDFKKELVYVM